MTLQFPANIPLISDGQPVQAGVVNNPLRLLDQRTVALNEAITEAMIGSAVILREMPMEGANVLPGMSLYRGSDGVFRPALTAINPTTGSNFGALAEKSFVWGIVQSKINNTLGNIVVHGVLRFSSSDLAAVCETAGPTNGPVFLSATTGNDGFVTQRRPPIGVTIGTLYNDALSGNVYLMVNIGWKDPLEGHVHYHRQLTASLNAWETPAAASLNGYTVPAGALYRYKIEDDPVLDFFWPPIPISAVHYDVNGIAADLIANDTVLVNDEGIWWKSVSNLSTVRHDFYFTRMTFKTDASVVTSLTSDSDSLEIKNSQGNAATTGDLRIKLKFTVASEESSLNGQAVKEIDGMTAKLGPVVDGLRTTTPDYVTITGGSTVSIGGTTYRKGALTLSVLSGSAPREGPIDFVELNNVDVDQYNNVYYLALKQTVTGVVLGRVQLPVLGLPTSMTMTLHVSVLGRVNGTTPTLAVEYLVIPRQSSVNSPSALPTSFSAASSVTGVALTANQYYRADIALPPTINPGDIVYFKITRNGTGGYSGDVGLIGMRWRVDAV